MTSRSRFRLAARALWTLLAVSLAGQFDTQVYGLSEGFGSDKGGAEKTTGTVVSTKEQSVDLKVDSGQVTFYAAKRAKTVIETIGQLVPQDNVTITWREKSGKKWIEKIEGRGTLQGVVTARTDTWIQIKPDNGVPQKFAPAWIGGLPAEGGGFDKEMLKKISRAKAGDKVRLTWEISEGKRVVDVKFLSKSPGPSPTAKAPRTTPPHHPPYPPARHWIWWYKHAF